MSVPVRNWDGQLIQVRTPRDGEKGTLGTCPGCGEDGFFSSLPECSHKTESNPRGTEMWHVLWHTFDVPGQHVWRKSVFAFYPHEHERVARLVCKGVASPCPGRK